MGRKLNVGVIWGVCGLFKEGLLNTGLVVHLFEYGLVAEDGVAEVGFDAEEEFGFAVVGPGLYDVHDLADGEVVVFHRNGSLEFLEKLQDLLRVLRRYSLYKGGVTCNASTGVTKKLR